MKFPGDRGRIQPAAAVADGARPPKAAALIPSFSKVLATASLATSGQDVAPITASPVVATQPTAPVAAKGPPAAARGDDDLMCQRL